MAVFYMVNAAVHFSFMPQVATPATSRSLHSVFNVTATLVLLPFGKLLEKLACLTIREKRRNRDSCGSRSGFHDPGDPFSGKTVICS